MSCTGNMTPLHMAARCGYDELVQILLDAQANSNASDVKYGVYSSCFCNLRRCVSIQHIIFRPKSCSFSVYSISESEFQC